MKKKATESQVFYSPDSGDYLDAFIQRKLREAGRTMGDEQKIKTNFKPGR